MISYPERWRETDLQLRVQAIGSYKHACAIYDALYAQARHLGVLPTPDPLEGIDVDIRLASALNSLPHA